MLPAQRGDLRQSQGAPASRIHACFHNQEVKLSLREQFQHWPHLYLQALKLSSWDAPNPEGLLVPLGSAHVVASPDFLVSVFPVIVTPVP